MDYDRLKETALSRAAAEVLADAADLIRREVRLARAELSTKLAVKVQGGIWIGLAGVFALVALFQLTQAIAFAIASTGLALHWACLIVAGGLLVIAGVATLIGRARLGADPTPHRTLRNLQNDVSMAKEQLT